MNENIKELIRLTEENPELPIVAMVDGDICGGDTFARWVGEIGRCYIDEYVIDEYYGDGCIKFKSDDNEDTIFDPFIEKGIIALDACTAHSKKMNVLVIREDV